jgi:hypothetical protein
MHGYVHATQGTPKWECTIHIQPLAVSLDVGQFWDILRLGDWLLGEQAIGLWPFLFLSLLMSVEVFFPLFPEPDGILL